MIYYELQMLWESVLKITREDYSKYKKLMKYRLTFFKFMI